jgi:hypothetical protein
VAVQGMLMSLYGRSSGNYHARGRSNISYGDCHDSLAVRTNLARRGMELDTRCVVSNRLDEDGGHLFCKCKYVFAKDMLTAVWELEEKDCILVVTLLWHWWLERNKIREGERRDSAGLAFIIRYQAEEFVKISERETPMPSRAQKRWSKPTADVLKINSDGAFDPVTKSGGWGFIIRDADGAVIQAGAGAVPNAMDALHTEVLGCLAGVKAAGEWGMTKIIAETDSMLLKGAVDGVDFLLAPTGGLL